jgi:hypothetical protein
MHPNRTGVAKIVAGIMPAVEAALGPLSDAGASSVPAGNR